MAANTTEQLLAAAPNTKAIKDQLLRLVPDAEDLVRMAATALQEREAATRRDTMEQLGKGVAARQTDLAKLAEQVEADDATATASGLKDEAFAGLVAQAKSAIDRANAAAEAAAQAVARGGGGGGGGGGDGAADGAGAGADAGAGAGAGADASSLAEAEAARAELNEATAAAKEAADKVHEALAKQLSRAAAAALLDTSGALGAVKAELQTLVKQNKDDGEPSDDASEAIEAAQVAVFAVEALRDEIEVRGNTGVCFSLLFFFCSFVALC